MPGPRPVTFDINMMRKDQRLLIDTAAHAHAPLYVFPAVAARVDAAIKEGKGGMEFIDAFNEVADRAKPILDKAKQEQK